MVTAVVSNYWVLIPAVLVMTIFLAFRWYFLKTSREIKRLEAIGMFHYVVLLPGLPHFQHLAGYSMQVLEWEDMRDFSLLPRRQILRARPVALSKNRVWTHSLVKLGCNHTNVSACCRTNQIALVK